MSPQEFMAGWVKFATDELFYDGQYYGLPMDTDTRGMYVNLDLADEAGIDRALLDPENGPLSYDQMWEIHDEVSVQAPPNLSAPDDHALLLAAGLNDWGGISPLTPDYVNPEAPWPHVAALAASCRAAGYTLEARLPIYPRFVDAIFLDPALHPAVERFAARTPPAPSMETTA